MQFRYIYLNVSPLFTYHGWLTTHDRLSLVERADQRLLQEWKSFAEAASNARPNTQSRDGAIAGAGMALTGLLPCDEAARLAAVNACAVLDTAPEAPFNGIVFSIAQMFRAPIAILTVVGERRVWAKAKVGPVGTEWARGQSFCHHIVVDRGLLVVEDASADTRFATMPIVMADPQIRFVAGAPLHGPDSHVIGALCVMDLYPRSISERQKLHLRQFAAEAGELLRMRIPGLDLSR